MVVTDDCYGFVVITFAALVAGIVLVDEATVIVPYCELVIALEFDTVAAYVAGILYTRVGVAFHTAVYLVVKAVLSPLGEIEVYVDVVFLVLPVLQKALTELYIRWTSCDLFSYQF